MFRGRDRMRPRKVKILERAETMGDIPPRHERLWENVTRPILDRVTLCYTRFECFHWIVRSSRDHYWIQTDRVL